ncbi:hypothetical protein [Alkalispirochaeta americana]|uniref:hypothetical protein n=1 Tax=Alkalispirochaeta americana TaxID=159291 RepID=UPI000970D61F|nr:hypothetical protein [Alkalispirochaeta americana]
MTTIENPWRGWYAEYCSERRRSKGDLAVPIEMVAPEFPVPFFLRFFPEGFRVWPKAALARGGDQ